MQQSQIEYNKRLSVLRKEKRLNGECRLCDQPTSETSVVYCDFHLKQQNKKGIERIARWPVALQKYRVIQRQKKLRNIIVAISLEEFVEWYETQPKVCCYCGIDETMLATQKDKKKRRLTIDRMKNEIGYELSNICLACFRCNHFKSDFFTHAQWKKIAEDLIQPRINEYHHIQTIYSHDMQ